MKDGAKTCLALVFFFSMFIIPLIALAVGWIGWDFKTGAIAGLISMAVLFLLGGIMLALIKDPSWITTSIPVILGSLYGMLPDFVPGPVDDTAMFGGGAILSFLLWLKKQPNTPKWIILPLLAASVFTFIGGFIPGPIDEMIVYTLTGISVIYGLINQPKGPLPDMPIRVDPRNDNVIDAEARELPETTVEPDIIVDSQVPEPEYKPGEESNTN